MSGNKFFVVMNFWDIYILEFWLSIKSLVDIIFFLSWLESKLQNGILNCSWTNINYNSNLETLL